MPAHKQSLDWQLIALATSAALELLFLLSRFTFHWSFPDIHQPVSFILLLALMAVLVLSFLHLSWGFTVLLITAFVPCNLNASRPHLLPVSPIDYVCGAAFVACAFRINLKEAWSRIKTIFGAPALIFWGLFYIYSFTCLKIYGGNARDMIRWIEFIFVFFLASLIPGEDRTETRSRLARLLSVLGGVCAIWGIAQILAARFDFTSAWGPFGQHNVLSGFLSLCFPASLWAAYSAKERKIYSVLSFLIFLGLLAAFSRGALLSLILAFSFVSLWVCRPEQRIRNLLYVGGTLLVVISFLAIFHRLSWPNGRNVYWATGIDILRHHLWTGVGPGNYAATLPKNLKGSSLAILQDELINKHRNDFWQHLHSLYLQMAVEYGLIGFTLWFLGLYFLIGPCFTELRLMPSADYKLRFYFSVSILAYLLHNMVDILFTNNLETIFAFLVALSYSGSNTL
jgi:O-antigen ligase